MTNMNMGSKRQSQFELFPGASGNTPQTGRPASLTKDLTLPLENIIVLCIVVVMALVFFFSCGVERGKKLASWSGSRDKVRAIKSSNTAPLERVSESVPQKEQGEQVVYPVVVPRELTDESAPSVQPPLEKNKEQKQVFTIQVASFKLEKNAQKEADYLRGIGHGEAFVLPKGSYSIVCVGKFMQMNEAKRYTGKLKKEYNDCLVRRL